MLLHIDGRLVLQPSDATRGICVFAKDADPTIPLFAERLESLRHLLPTGNLAQYWPILDLAANIDKVQESTLRAFGLDQIRLARRQSLASTRDLPMTFAPESFLRLAGLRDGEIASVSQAAYRTRLFQVGRWSVAPAGRDARFRMCVDRLRLLGLDRAGSRGGVGALAWRSDDPAHAVGAIAVGARVGTSGWAPALAMPLPAG
jgi:hypothetical protein